MPSSKHSDILPIAIIGLGCRFPKAPNVTAYWRMMLDGVDGISEVPPDRWDVDAFYDPRPATPCKTATRYGGFLDDIEHFDPYFFGISPREAVRMDPQQRLLLEVTWQAMEHAGFPRERFMGSHTGVFMGVCTDDYMTLQRSDLKNIDLYSGTGGSRGSTAGRLAFAYGLRGPTAAIDTACSSSLVAVHEACNSLQLGDCDMALAGGVNVVLHPGTAVAFSQAGMLSSDGRCKAFDSRANGFVRSEGAGVVLLKPLARALEDGDPVYAVIRASASNNDGSSSPFMTPSRSGQAELLRSAYERAGVAPETVQYVEAHGTGTAVGDPVEIGALADVIGAGMRDGQTCILGSSKTNIGHTEAAAGVAGLIKTVLSLHNRIIPPNLHFVTPNPAIPWEALPFRVPTVATPWPEHGSPARAGVNSFGISGTNAHVVLEQAPQQTQQKQKQHHAENAENAEILMLSANSSDALEMVAASYGDLVCNGGSDSSLRDLCYSAAVRRTHHEYRLGIVSRSREELKLKLDAFLAGEMLPDTGTGAASADGNQGPVFVFSGIGTQWPGMGQRLRVLEPVFNDALLQCDAVIRGIVGWSVIEEIDRPANESRLDRIDIMQPAIFSVQVALAALWRSWDVEPIAIVGHSLGEIAAAYISGALSLEDAALVACMRSRLMHRTSGLGRMAAVGMTAEQAARRIEEYAGRISVAAINSPSSCALSGDSAAVEEIAGALEAEGVFCRLLKVDVACHSHHMDSLRAELAGVLAGITPRAANIPLYSTVLSRRVSGVELDADYWATNLRQPVQFAETMNAMLSDGRRVFLEVSPNPALLTPIRQIAQLRSDSIVAAPSLRAGNDEREVLLESIGSLFTHGVPLDWTRLYPVGKFVSPPPYVWQRERFWFSESSADMSWLVGGSATGPHHMKHPLLSVHWEPADDPGTHCFEAELDLKSMASLRDHCVEGMPLLPATAYIEMAIAASIEITGPGPRTLRNIQLDKALFLSSERPDRVQLIVRSGSSRHPRHDSAAPSPMPSSSMSFQFYSRHETSDEGASHHGAEYGSDGWVHLASGYIDVGSQEGASASAVPEFLPDDLDRAYPVQKTGEQFYLGVVSGMEFGPSFRSVQRSWGRDKSAVTLIELPTTTKADARLYRLHPALLDACFHSLSAVPDKKPLLSLPFAIDEIELRRLPDPAEQLWCRIHSRVTDAGYTAEITMFDRTGECTIHVTGYQTRILETRATQPDDPKHWLYEHRWVKVERARQREARAGRWLIVGGADAAAKQLCAALEAHGQTCMMSAGRATREEFADDLQRLTSLGACQGIVHLGALKIGSDAPVTPALLDDAATHGCESLLNLLQACAEVQWTEIPRVFVVSRNARDLGLEQQGSLELAQAPLAGLARVAAIELREFQITQLDIETNTSADVLVQELLHADDELEVALRHDDRYALRLARLDTANRATRLNVRITDEGTQSYRLESAGTGVFDGLKLRGLERQAPGAGEVEIRVAAVALNFLDVLKALNMAPGLPAGAEYFGMECSGRVVAVGEQVEGFKVGDEVIALDSTTTGCFRAFFTTSATAVFAKPAHLTLEEAATIPVAYQTAYYALCDLGRLRAGESVLIHSAAGGVGMAAMEIARQRGAVIFATAGNEEKREYLKRMGAQYVMNSHTLDFAREVMEYTDGRGVDMVLNSLAGEAIPKSLSVLTTGGRFLEIGKRDIYADSQLGLLPFQRNLSFFAVDLLRMRMEKPQVVDELTRDVVQHISDGSFPALPYTTFPVTEVADAFRYMAQGKHVGKIVITLDDAAEVEIENVPRPVPIRADGTYLITGGLGALGLAFAHRLVNQGARHLALMGRHAPSATAQEMIDELRSVGAQVTVVAADVSDARQLARALTELRVSGPPLRGVLHAAGVTNDRTLQQLRWEDFAPVFAPKVVGSWNLHTELQSDELDFFVLFSSATSVLGGAGQANYAAANSFLDGLAHFRRRAGLPALAVNWGPWADIGMAAQDDIRGARLAERGLESIPVREGTELLDLVLQQRPAQVAVMPIDWHVWAQSFPESVRSPLLSELTSEWAGDHKPQAVENGIRQLLLACESNATALELLIAYLRKDVAKVLRISEEKLNPRTSLTRFGLDSLMAVELKNRIEGDFGVRLPAARLLQGPTMTELAEWLNTEVRATDTTKMIGAREATLPAESAVDVDELSDDEVSSMLNQILTESGSA